MPEVRRPRSPSSRSNSRLQYPRATAATASIASSASGARPSPVWSKIPVALITGRSRGLVFRTISLARLARLSASTAAYWPF